eukprot:766794-Hanusia_phi.AAC.4
MIGKRRDSLSDRPGSESCGPPRHGHCQLSHRGNGSESQVQTGPRSEQVWAIAIFGSKFCRAKGGLYGSLSFRASVGYFG